MTRAGAKSFVGAVAVLLLAGAGRAQAQPAPAPASPSPGQSPAAPAATPAPTPCRDGMAAKARPTEDASCESAAKTAAIQIDGWLFKNVNRKAVEKLAITSALVQPQRDPSHGAPGTAAQTDATPSVKTAGLAAAKLTAAAVDQGTEALAVVTLNPLGLITLDDPASFAKQARLTNLSIVLPAQRSTNEFPTFVGLRARVDLAGLFNGAELMKRGNETLAAFKGTLSSVGKIIDLIKARLGELTVDPTAKKACVEALMKETVTPEDVDAACGTRIVPEAALLANAEAAFAARMTELKRAVDGFEGGVNLLADIPLEQTGQVVQPPLRLAADAVLGLRQGSAPDGKLRSGLRLSAGVDYLKPDLVPATWGASASLTGTADAALEDAPVHFSLGFKGHVGDLVPPGAAGIATGRTGDWLDLQVGLSVPTLGSSGLDVVLSWPVSREDPGHGPMLSFSYDWAYLLGRKS